MLLLRCAGTALALAGCSAFTPSNAPNMNGDYVLSKTPGVRALTLSRRAATVSHRNLVQAPAEGSFPTDFKDYPGGVEYFDVYHGPITSVYSQVWWTSTKNDIPADIVERFKGKVMAIVGMESDQVRKGAGPNGEDVSVPISMAYNHQ